MAELLRPLAEPADKRGVREERLCSAPRSEDIDLRVTAHHATIVLDAVSGADPGLHGHITQARVHRQVDTVVGVVDPAEVVAESPEVAELSKLPRLDVVEGQRISAAARQFRIRWHVVNERIEVCRRERAVDRY